MKRVLTKKNYYYTFNKDGIRYEYYLKKFKYDGKWIQVTGKNANDWKNNKEAKILKIEEEKAKIQLEKELADKNIVKYDSTISDIQDEYLKDTQNNFSSGTYIRREKYLRLYIVPKFKNTKFSDLTNLMISEYYEEVIKSKGLTLVENLHKVLNSLINYAVEKKIGIDANPISTTLMKKLRKNNKRIKLDELNSRASSSNVPLKPLEIIEL